MIFPLVTLELFKLSEYKEQFLEKNIQVVVSDYHYLSIVNDKSRLYCELSEKGIELPEFRVVNDYHQFLNAKTYFLEKHGGYCIKPSISNGSRGVRLITKSINEFDMLFKQKPNSLYISDEKLSWILKKNHFPQLLISEILPGDEFTIDTVVNTNNEPIVIIPRRRVKTVGGISTAGRFEENEEIISYTKKILANFKLTGPIGLQVKQNKDGEYRLLEINPRIQGTSVASLGIGINLPEIAIKAILNKPMDEPQLNWGTNFIRYYEEVFY